MKAKCEIHYDGSSKDDVFKALNKVEKFLKKEKHEKMYKYIYVSLDDVDGIDHHISEGKSDLDIDKELKRVRKMVQDIIDSGKFDRFWISANVSSGN